MQQINKQRFLFPLLMAIVMMVMNPLRVFADDGPVMDQPYTKDRTKAFGYEFTTNELIAYPQLTNLPTIYINVYAPYSYDTGEYSQFNAKTMTVADLADKYNLAELSDISNAWNCAKHEYYYQCQIIIRDDNGTIKERNELVGMRGRGNSTWNSGSKKKPWRLKFPAKTKLLAERDAQGNEVNNYADNKSWTLMSNLYDKTLFRNALTSELGKRAGLEYNPAYRFVDLVINGTKMGTYQIGDHMNVDSKRVNVDSDTGWFTEFCTTNFAEDPYFKAGSYYVGIKNPEADVATSSGETTDTKYNDMKTWYTTYVQNLTNGNYEAWRKQTDLPSLIAWMIIEDLAGNYDGAMANVYNYRNVSDTKLKFGPLWDLDIAYGNYSQLTDTHFWNAQGQGCGSLFAKMYENDPYFVKALYEQWTAFKNGSDLATFVSQKVAAFSTLLAESQALNYSLYSSGDNFNKYDVAWNITSDVSWCSKGVADYSTATSAVTSYITDRISWLESEYKSQYEKLGCATLAAETPEYHYTIYAPGEDGVAHTTTDADEVATLAAAITDNTVIVTDQTDAVGKNIIIGSACQQLVLDDASAWTYPSQFRAATATYTRSMTNKWGTLVVPFKVTVDSNSPYDFYQITSVSGDMLELTKITKSFSAGTPVLIRMSEAAKNAETGKYVLTLNAVDKAVKPEITNPEDNGLTGSYTATEITNKNGYIIANNSFWNIENLNVNNNKIYNAPFRAYLATSAPNNAKMLTINDDDNDDATGINQVTTISPLGELEGAFEGVTIYNLNGQRLPDLQQGINIVKRGNKTYKVIVK